MASLADAVPAEGKSKGAIAVSVSASPISVDDAAKRLMAAVHAHDVDQIADALRLAYHACAEEEKGSESSPESGGEY